MTPNPASVRLNVLQFRINGSDYTLRGDMSVERMEQIVDLLTGKIEEIKSASPSLTPNRVAMLAALQLAEDVLALREDNELMLAEAKSAAFPRFTLPERKSSSGD